MSTDVQLEQTRAEEITYPLDYAPQLLTSVTVTGATCIHTPPEGGAPLTITPTLVDGIIYVPIPKNLDLGVNYFSVVANTSNPDVSPEILLIITVLR